MNTTIFKNKLITQSLVFSLVFLLGINGVKAKKSYDVEKNEKYYTSVQSEIKAENSEKLIICSYGCSSDNSGFDEKQCGNVDEDFSAILYNTNETQKWQIIMNEYLYQAKTVKKELGGATIIPDKSKPIMVNKFVWNQISDNVPSGGIYYEKPSSNRKINEDWLNTSAYTNLKTSFTCPQYLYYDHSLRFEPTTDNNMELCYANNKEQCMSRNEEEKTTFGKANNLKYSFTQELNDVLTYTNDDIMLTKPEDMLLNYYDSQESICTAFNNDKEWFTNGYDVNYPAFLKKSFDNYSSGSPNKFIYTYENITKLLGSNNLNLTYQGAPLKTKYDAMKQNYVNKMKESIEYYSEKCNVPENVAEIIANEVSEDLSEKIDEFEKTTLDKEIIDTESLNCDNLFADIADLLKTAYFLIEIGAILIVVVLSVLDYAKIFLADNQDAMKKANQHLMRRLIILVVIFLLPALVNLTLRIFKIKGFDTDTPLCMEIKG